MENNPAWKQLEMYKDLFDNAHDLIHFVRPDGTILYVNASWSATLGYTTEEIQGKSIYSLVAPRDEERFRRYRHEALQGTVGKRRIVVALMGKNGTEVHIEGFALPKREGGVPVYTTGIFRDITENVRNQERLAEREHNLQQLISHAPDAVIVINAGGIVTLWNPKAEAIFGWTAAEVLGRPLTDTIIPPQYREAHNRGMQRYLATGEVRVLNRSIEVSALHKSGREFHISLTISTVLQGGATAFVAFIRDITEQKRNALELEQKTNQLESSNRELEQFAYAASHDLQEPLRKIRTFASYLLDERNEQLTARGRDYLRRIDGAATRMRAIINALLQYSAHPHEEEAFEPTDLNTVLGHVRSDLELLIEQKDAVLESDPLPTIRAIPVQMDQLFYNLVHNALKFSRPGVPPHVRITHRLLPGEPALLELTFNDNGIGFEAFHKEKVFGLFQRLHDAAAYEGTGVGLTLCKKIVANHHGQITVQSAPGVGTTFVVTLPAGSLLQ